MKKLTLFLFMALLLAVVFQRCNQDDVSSSVEKIKFSISVSPSSTSNGGRIKVALPAESSVMLTIETSAGDPVLTNELVKIYVFGDSYVTDPVELAPGNYSITDFLVVDQGSDVLFAAPKKGSPLASVVSNPLPRSLHISKNLVANVDMQVLDVNQSSPEDFGYAAFHIDAGSNFRISVFADIDGKTKLTDAKAYVINAENYEDTLYHYSLQAKVNNMFFGGDPDKEYRLVVIKPRYDPYSITFKFSELPETPLKVNLQQRVFTLWYSPHTIPEEPQIADFSMSLGADEAAAITVDFGDGTVKNYSIPAGGDVSVARTMTTGDHVIRVTGDIEKITTFGPYWEGQVKAIDFSDVINLRRIDYNPLGFFGVVTVDLTYNRKMEYAYIGGFALDTVRLPYPAPLKYLNISSSPNLSADEINSIIYVLHADVVNKHIMNGGFENRAGNGTMQGPPSSYAMDQLRELRDTYHWGISPNPN